MNSTAEPSAAVSPAEPKTDFGALFKASFRTLWLVAFGVVQDATLAEDVVQEAALVALSKFGEFRPGSNYTAWMAKIVQFVARNQARSRRRRRLVSLQSAAGQIATDQGGTADHSRSALAALAADQPHFDDRMMAALRRVADVPRMCLLLRTIEGMEYAEIARLLGIPAGTAMSHVHRTRQFLRQELADLRPVGSEERPAPS